MLSAMTAPRVDLWSRRALVLGQLGAVGAHAHAATALLFGVNGTFRLRDTQRNEVFSGLRHAVVPLGCLHELACGDTTMAVMLLAPGQHDHERLYMHRGFEDGTRVLRPEPSMLALDTFAAMLGGEVVASEVDHFQRRLAGPPPAAFALDMRVDRVADLISARPEQQLPIATLARRARLSPSRLQHLFRQGMGITPRRLRTWQRMREVSRHVAAGHNLTRAAHAAGFTDSAHLSRAFRTTFGLPPSRVLTVQTRVVVHADGSLDARQPDARQPDAQ